MRYAIPVPIIRIVFTFRKIARLAIYKYNDNQPFGHEKTPHIDRNRKTKNEKRIAFCVRQSFFTLNCVRIVCVPGTLTITFCNLKQWIPYAIKRW